MLVKQNDWARIVKKNYDDMLSRFPWMKIDGYMLRFVWQVLNPLSQGRNVGLKSGGTNLGVDNVAYLGTYRQVDFLV